MTRRDRSEFQSFYQDRNGAYRLLHDVFSSSSATWYNDVSSRTLYFSRVENNRRAHAENGNTMHLADDHCGLTAYMSNKSRNRLAHAENGNTAKQLSPQELYETLVNVPVHPHRCKGRTYTLSHCLRQPQEGSDFCAQHTKTLKHGRVDNPVPEDLKHEFLKSGHKCLQPKHINWYSRRRMWQWAIQ